MNSIAYRLRYFFGSTPWDSRQVPPEVVAAFQEGSIPGGPALDLGCGTGTCVIYMAAQGREAYGIDFIPRAIKTAHLRAKEAGLAGLAHFFAADVTRLGNLGLPNCAFALDMGCFHSLRGEDRERYSRALTDILIPGGRYMLYAMEPVSERGAAYGLTPGEVVEIFAPAFDIVQTRHGEFRRRGSNWFWMMKKESFPISRI